MKYFKTILMVIIILFKLNSFAQYVEEKPQEKLKEEKPVMPTLCVKDRDIIIDGFYGFPYLGSVLFQSDATNVHNLNTVGAKFEYMISDKIGLGIEATYSSATATYQGNVNSSTGSTGTVIYYNEALNKTRVLGKMNFHFSTTKNLDPYFTVGAGYKNVNYTTNQPYQAGISQDLSNIDPFYTLCPVSVRIGIGFRCYFSEILGLNAEFGIGGPLIQAGLSFKI